jgi:hypothetical protein
VLRDDDSGVGGDLVKDLVEVSETSRRNDCFLGRGGASAECGEVEIDNPALVLWVRQGIEQPMGLWEVPSIARHLQIAQCLQVPLSHRFVDAHLDVTAKTE